MERYPKKLIFIHIPKTGGSTMKGPLDSIYGKNMISDKSEYRNMAKQEQGLESSSYYYTKKFWLQYTCIIGHFPLSKYSMLKQEGWKFMTWLRDPVERIISRYSDRRFKGGMKLMSDFMDIDIIEFSKRLKNVYPLYLDILDILDFVGFTETFDESLYRLKEIVNGEVELKYERQNVTKHKVEVSKNYRSKIKDNLKTDYKMYNELWERFG